MEIFFAILVNDVFPLFIVAFVGYLLASKFDVNVRTVSIIGLYALLPCLIFTTLTTTEINLFESSRIAVYCLVIILSSGLIAKLVSLALHLNKATTKALMLVTMFTNVGNFGLPVVSFAFDEVALGHATIYFVSSNILLYTVGIAILSGGQLNWKKALLVLGREPIVYSIVLAVVAKQFRLELPEPVDRALFIMGQGAIPVMLLVLGMRLYHSKVEWKPILALAVVLRLVLIPLFAFPIGLLMRLNGAALQAGVLQSAAPAGVSTTLMATEYEVEPDFVNSVVVLSTLFCVLTMTPIILFLKALG